MFVNAFPVEILPTPKYYTSWELIQGFYFFILRHSVLEYPVPCRRRVVTQLNLCSFESQSHILYDVISQSDTSVSTPQVPSPPISRVQLSETGTGPMILAMWCEQGRVPPGKGCFALQKMVFENSKQRWLNKSWVRASLGEKNKAIYICIYLFISVAFHCYSERISRKLHFW